MVEQTALEERVGGGINLEKVTKSIRDHYDRILGNVLFGVVAGSTCALYQTPAVAFTIATSPAYNFLMPPKGYHSGKESGIYTALGFASHAAAYFVVRHVMAHS